MNCLIYLPYKFEAYNLDITINFTKNISKTIIYIYMSNNRERLLFDFVFQTLVAKKKKNKYVSRKKKRNEKNRKILRGRETKTAIILDW